MRHRPRLFVMGLLTLCGIAAADSPYTNMSYIDGWAEKVIFFEGGRYDPDAQAPDADIDGEVGHPLFVKGPTNDCTEGPLIINLSVASGELPPGLTMNTAGGTSYGDITGIPTARGHWIVTMRASEVSCGGESYPGFTQQLRFHITGSGKVIE